MIIFKMEFHMEIYIKKNINMHKSCLTLVIPWTVAYQALVHGIFQERMLEWVAMPSPGDFHNSGLDHGFPVLHVVSCTAGGFFTNWVTKEALIMHSLTNFYKMNKYIYHPEQETGITGIPETSLLPYPNDCIPLKIVLSSITINWFYLLLILI